MRYVMKIAYDGTSYAGWQRQKNAMSVQEALENAILQALRVDVRVTASGRTDAGVHAAGQVCHFDSDTLTIPPEKMPDCLNRFLPPDIRIVDGWGADGDFGNDTYNAVIKFQKDHNLEVDGVVGKNTREAIEKALKSKETPKTESIKNTDKFAKGDIVMFKGGKHYLSSRSTSGSEAKAGKAKITMIFSGTGVKHPYHLVRTVGGGSNVYGWVDEADIEAL